MSDDPYIPWWVPADHPVRAGNAGHDLLALAEEKIKALEADGVMLRDKVRTLEAKVEAFVTPASASAPNPVVPSAAVAKPFDPRPVIGAAPEPAPVVVEQPKPSVSESAPENI